VRADLNLRLADLQTRISVGVVLGSVYAQNLGPAFVIRQVLRFLGSG
jgi:hypothetical protein